MIPVALGEVVDVGSVFDAAVKAVQGDVNGMIIKALPVGLAIAGIILGIRIGWKFFKSVAK